MVRPQISIRVSTQSFGYEPNFGLVSSFDINFWFFIPKFRFRVANFDINFYIVLKIRFRVSRFEQSFGYGPEFRFRVSIFDRVSVSGPDFRIWLQTLACQVSVSGIEFRYKVSVSVPSLFRTSSFGTNLGLHAKFSVSGPIFEHF